MTITLFGKPKKEKRRGLKNDVGFDRLYDWRNYQTMEKKQETYENIGGPKKMKCPECKSIKTWKNGLDNNRQRFQCVDCRYVWTE
jgi:transposase-like protein